MCVGGRGVFPHTQHQAILELYQQGVQEHNSILILFAWGYHQIPQVKGSILQDYPPPPIPHSGHKPQADPCASNLLATDWRFLQPPP